MLLKYTETKETKKKMDNYITKSDPYFLWEIEAKRKAASNIIGKFYEIDLDKLFFSLNYYLNLIGQFKKRI